MQLQLIIHRGNYAISRLDPGSARTDPGGGSFSSVSRLGGETTVVGLAEQAPTDAETKSGFRLIEIQGEFPLDSSGVVAAVAAPLAAAAISLFAFSVWSTDAFLIQDVDLAHAKRVLAGAGHSLVDA